MIIGNCRFADDVLYDPSIGTWVRFSRASQGATVGIDTIFAWLMGRVTSVSFKPTGGVIERGKALGAVESARHFDVVRAPISGRILAVNDELAGNPRLLNHDPYGEGWFAKLEPLEGAAVAGVEPPEAARPALEAKIAELKIRCFAEYPDQEMYEIGTECSAVLVRLDELLSGSKVGTVVHLVSDDPSSQVEMVGWADRTGNALLETRREDKLVHYIVKKTGER